MTHTKGPWKQPMRYSPEDGCDIPAGQIEGPAGQVIASFAGFADLGEIAANARLIAAAPDAVQLAEKIIEWYETDHDDSSREAPLRREHELYQQAQAFLARATGQ